MRSGQPVQPPAIAEFSHPRQGGRPDACPPRCRQQKVTGQAIYTDDLQFEGMLHARVKRALVPAGVVRRFDVTKARALPGVAAVLTAADIPGEHNHGLVTLRLAGPGRRGRRSALLWATPWRSWPPKHARSPARPWT